MRARAHRVLALAAIAVVPVLVAPATAADTAAPSGADPPGTTEALGAEFGRKAGFVGSDVLILVGGAAVALMVGGALQRLTREPA